MQVRTEDVSTSVYKLSPDLVEKGSLANRTFPVQISAADTIPFSWEISNALTLPALIKLSESSGEVEAGLKGNFSIALDASAVANHTEGESVVAVLNITGWTAAKKVSESKTERETEKKIPVAINSVRVQARAPTLLLLASLSLGSFMTNNLVLSILPPSDVSQALSARAGGCQ